MQQQRESGSDHREAPGDESTPHTTETTQDNTSSGGDDPSESAAISDRSASVQACLSSALPRAPVDSNTSTTTDASTSEVPASGEKAEVDPLDLRQWGLPAEVVAGYAQRGVSHLFPWQLECLSTGNVLTDAENLVYSAPTSAGKTLVAEILMLKRILETKTKALLVLPFVAASREKELAMAELFCSCGVRVGGFFGHRTPPGGLSAVDLAVCTIERANGLLNRMLLEQGTLEELGILVVDELHFISDPQRGYLLELMLTKVASAKKRDLVGSSGLQVVAMSATAGNLDTLAHWLDAKLYETDYRPVPLRQLFKFGQKLCEGPELTPVRALPATECAGDYGEALQLSLESLAEGHGLLVFYPTRRECKEMALELAHRVSSLVQPAASVSGGLQEDSAKRPRLKTSSEKRERLLQRWKDTPGANDNDLKRCLSMQVAFHHAGLTREVRDLIENAFRMGEVLAIVATTTLSSGVNLPARRVIIPSCEFFGRNIDFRFYHQMIGRAGRKGFDTQGESILICKPSEKSLAKHLSSSEPPPITSCLTSDSTGLRRALLEAVTNGSARSLEDLSLYNQCTLRYHLSSGRDGGAGRKKDITEALKFLHENQLVHCQEDANGEKSYHPSRLGEAVLASGLSPDDGLAMVKELERARQQLVLDTDLHLLYLVTPPFMVDQLKDLDSKKYHELCEGLSDAQRLVAGLVDIPDQSFLRLRSKAQLDSTRATENNMRRRRFRLALALEKLTSESSLPQVASEFKLEPVLLQSLQENTPTFAGIATTLCQRLGWCRLELLLTDLQTRLRFGIQQELGPLLELPSLNGPLARLVFDAGFVDPAALAQVTPSELDIALRNAGPFEHRETILCWHLPSHGTVSTTSLAKILVQESHAISQRSVDTTQVSWAPTSPSGDSNSSDVSEAALVRTANLTEEPSLLRTSFDNISGATCSLKVSTLSGIFSSAGSNGVPKLENERLARKRGRSWSSGAVTKRRKRSASESKLRSLTDDSDFLLADLMQGDFTWKQVESAEDFIYDWGQQQQFSISLAVQAHTQSKLLIEPRCPTHAKLPENTPLIVDGMCLMGVAVCWNGYNAHFLSLERADPRLWKLLSQRLAKAERVVVPDVSQAMRFLARRCGLDPAQLGWEEPRMADWLLGPSKGKVSLESIVIKWAPYLMPLLKGVNRDGGMIGEEASARLAVVVLHLQKALMIALKKAGMYTLYHEQELRFRGVLCKMDLNGFLYDPSKAQQTMSETIRALDALKTDARALAGPTLDLDSTSSVEAFLKARVLPQAKGPLPPGSLSSRDVLAYLSRFHQLPKKIIDKMKLDGVISHSLRSVAQHVQRLQPGGDTIRIRPWNQPWTATGRVMVTKPNLQSIAKNFTVCTQPPVTIKARAAFRPSTGAVLMSADYSNLELRLLAHLSEDEKMLEVFRAGGDVFRRMAALWSDCDEDTIDDSLRQRTKQICYGITYGQGARSLAQQLGVKCAEAENMIGQFRQAFPGLERFSSHLVEHARVTGEVRTLLGRRRSLPNLHSESNAIRAKAERQALSTAVQGSAADLLRRALLSLDDALAQRFPGCQGILPEEGPLQGGAFIILQVHDELLLEVCERDLHDVSALVRHCMEGAMELSVPLKVGIRVGRNWADLDELSQD